jgi:hypothetical protein
MGFFTAPTKDEVAKGLAPFLDGDQVVHAYVIGQAMGGRMAVVATENAVHVVTVKLTKLKGTLRVAKHALGDVGVKRSGLRLSVGKDSVKLGMADKARAAELEAFVNGRLTAS